MPHPAVARIIVPEGELVAFGSGTLVDVREEFGLVVTNWHVVRDATGVIEVVFTNGQQIGAVLDRNGLRPGRYWLTHDDRIIARGRTVSVCCVMDDPDGLRPVAIPASIAEKLSVEIGAIPSLNR